MKNEQAITDLFQEFISLGFPSKASNTYIAKPLSSNMSLRVAIDPSGAPALLINTSKDGHSAEGETIAYKHIKFSANCFCRIQTGTTITESNIALISCTAEDPFLREYFLRSLSGIVSTISQCPSQKETLAMVEKLLELYRLLSQPARNSIQGLWGELFLICTSTDPESAVRAWHTVPNALFDFRDEDSAIEVKTAQGDQRCHHFSIHQLNPAHEIKLSIASLLIKEACDGSTIYDLVSLISERNISPESYSKLSSMILATLGRDWMEQKRQRYNIDSASKSLKFFQYHSIPQIGLPLPDGVSDVSFLSNLTNLTSLDSNNIDMTDHLLLNFLK